MGRGFARVESEAPPLFPYLRSSRLRILFCSSSIVCPGDRWTLASYCMRCKLALAPPFPTPGLIPRIFLFW